MKNSKKVSVGHPVKWGDGWSGQVISDNEVTLTIKRFDGETVTIIKAEVDDAMVKDREIPNTLEIVAFFHCGLCLAELPSGTSPQEYAQNECGWTPLGFQVWCRRHNVNVMHVDFEGVKHPANTTRRPHDATKH